MAIAGSPTDAAILLAFFQGVDPAAGTHEKVASLIADFKSRHGPSWQEQGYAEMKRERGIDPRDYWTYKAETFGVASSTLAATPSLLVATATELSPTQEILADLHRIPDPEWKTSMNAALTHVVHSGAQQLTEDAIERLLRWHTVETASAASVPTPLADRMEVLGPMKHDADAADVAQTGQLADFGACPSNAACPSLLGGGICDICFVESERLCTPCVASTAAGGECASQYCAICVKLYLRAKASTTLRDCNSGEI